jgi:hypothetical protein
MFTYIERQMCYFISKTRGEKKGKQLFALWFWIRWKYLSVGIGVFINIFFYSFDCNMYATCSVIEDYCLEKWVNIVMK